MLYYIHGPKINEIISDSRGYCYHTDGLGSVVNLTDSSGAKANSYTYTAFGAMRNQSGTVSNAWLFTGRQYDSESGLYYYRNRYYDPKTGRFITRDPIGIAGGINLYQYCGNNPVNATYRGKGVNSLFLLTCRFRQKFYCYLQRNRVRSLHLFFLSD